MTVVIGPIACINCGQKVTWHKDDGMWRLRDEDGQKHNCPSRGQGPSAKPNKPSTIAA